MTNKIIFDYIRIVIVLYMFMRIFTTVELIGNEQAIGEIKPSPSTISSVPASLDLFQWFSLMGEKL